VLIVDRLGSTARKPIVSLAPCYSCPGPRLVCLSSSLARRGHRHVSKISSAALDRSNVRDLSHRVCVAAHPSGVGLAARGTQSGRRRQAGKGQPCAGVTLMPSNQCRQAQCPASFTAMFGHRLQWRDECMHAPAGLSCHGRHVIAEMPADPPTQGWGTTYDLLKTNA